MLRPAAWISGLVMAALALGACAAPSSDDGDSLEQDESEATSAPLSWYRLRTGDGTLAIESLAGGAVTCADGATAARCPITFVDVRRAGIDAGDEARARIQTLAMEDGVVALGRTFVRATTDDTGTKTKTLRFLASRVYENVLRTSADGDLYEVTRLDAPAPCTLARSLPSPRGALAPPIVETFQGSCANRATKVGAAQSFVIDDPDWQAGRPTAADLATRLTTDLVEGDSVLVVGRWVSSDGPISRPQPQQVWRDMKRTLAR